jgi:hypothetical protein
MAAKDKMQQNLAKLKGALKRAKDVEKNFNSVEKTLADLGKKSKRLRKSQ